MLPFADQRSHAVALSAGAEQSDYRFEDENQTVDGRFSVSAEEMAGVWRDDHWIRAFGARRVVAPDVAALARRIV